MSIVSRRVALAPVVLALALVAFVSAGCRSVDVDAVHDPQFDFSTVHTFDWLSVPPQARTAVSDVSLVDLVRAELERHGLQRAQQDPGLLVAIHRSLEGNLNTTGWGYEASGGRMRHYTLQEGTLVIDLVDPRTRQSVWRGTASGVFRFDDDPAVLRRMVEDMLHEMFADFPPKR